MDLGFCGLLFFFIVVDLMLHYSNYGSIQFAKTRSSFILRFCCDNLWENTTDVCTNSSYWCMCNLCVLV